MTLRGSSLPEDGAARLRWLRNTCLAELDFFVDYASRRRHIGKGLYGPHAATMVERLGISHSPCEKLVPFLGMHVKEGVDGKRLKFL